MGEVDRNNTLIGSYICARKTFNWIVKVVMHFTEEPALSAFILFDKVYQGKICFMNFKMEVTDKIITRARNNSERNLSETPRLKDTS